ncbi:type II secretion system F family protein [Cryobacterium sp. TMT2-18-3]|uniref:type II secretion system F family protein n=1 Tax=unclassified Cryobacterium TaxID=2649013 RepID=UPI00106AA5C9|nr:MULTISPECIES: type II secretion system F family protein [unclassified Cryobacterium]TFC29450.1 type II secretion system F family protein [Cryobacterium sp. TMT2-18-2]TFC37503.1 type II secretion system F family protein [Cryobacterium sp. TMT2-42-4]TFC61596.1 type II secretion system F family protein [Cryobacterium sp. TMT2-18-3]
MPSLIAILASLAVAGGFAVLVGILVGGRAGKPVTDLGDAGLNLVGTTTAPVKRGRTMRELAPRGYLGMLDRRLALAGRPPAWTIDKILIAKPLAGTAGALLALLWISADPAPTRFVLGALLVLLCFFVPDLLLISRGQERQEKIQNALADTLDQMTIAVEAGLGFEAAMAKAATNGKGPLAEEFIRTLQDMSIGRTRTHAYQALGDRTSSSDLRRFTRSVIQADTYGIAIADVLRVQAGEMRLRRRQRAEEKAMKIPVKVLFPLIFCILPVLFIVLLTPAVLSMIEAFA